MSSGNHSFDFNGVSIIIEYEHSPFRKGDRGEYGEPLEPDDEEEFKITEVKIGNQDATDLFNCCADLSDKLHESAIESLSQR